MAYTIGTSHGPFTGTGSFVIAKPAGIRTIVTNIPAWTSHENENPRRYFRLGRFTLGNPHGFSESQLLEYAQQLVYPIAPIWELLAYDINDGASCTFYELVAVPDLTALQPWDRTPLVTRQNATVQAAGGTALTTSWSYTVPVGRRLMLSQASVVGIREAIATTIGGSQGIILLDGSSIISVAMSTNVNGATVTNELAGGPLYINPTQVLSATYVNPDAGGSIRYMMRLSGVLFDA